MLQNINTYHVIKTSYIWVYEFWPHSDTWQKFICLRYIFLIRSFLLLLWWFTLTYLFFKDRYRHIFHIIPMLFRFLFWTNLPDASPCSASKNFGPWMNLGYVPEKMSHPERNPVYIRSFRTAGKSRAISMFGGLELGGWNHSKFPNINRKL